MSEHQEAAVPTVHLVELTFDDDQSISIGAIAALYAGRPLLGARLVPGTREPAPPPLSEATRETLLQAAGQKARAPRVPHPMRQALLDLLPTPGDSATRRQLLDWLGVHSSEVVVTARVTGHLQHLVARGELTRPRLGYYVRPAESALEPLDPPSRPEEALSAALALFAKPGERMNVREVAARLGVDHKETVEYGRIAGHLARLRNTGHLTRVGPGVYERRHSEGASNGTAEGTEGAYHRLAPEEAVHAQDH